MEKLKIVYSEILDSLGETPSLSRDWRWLAVTSLVMYGLVLAFRLSFALRWEDPSLWVNGERILSTHDAYFWLAKAKGVGVIDGHPLAQLAAFFHDFLGVGYGAIGFWVPAFITSLIAVVCMLWGWLLAGRYGGLLAGLIGSLTPGFFYRSRLGYFDTDMFTLLGPFLVAFMLAYWLSLHLRKGWMKDCGGEHDEGTPSPWLAVGFGLIARVAGFFHMDIVQLNALLLLFALGVLVVAGRPGKRVPGAYGLIIILLTAFPGMLFGKLSLWPLSYWNSSMGAAQTSIHGLVGIVLACSLALILSKAKKPTRSQLNSPLVCAGMLVAVVLMTNVALAPVLGSLKQFITYFASSESQTVASADTVVRGPIYPAVVQSIIEAQLVPLADVLQRGIYSAWLAPFALLGMLAAVAFRPVSLLLLPLLVLHLASVKLGYRFTMFGGASLGIFFGVGVYWAFDFAARRLARRREIVMAGQALVAVGILAMAYTHFMSFPVAPVITQAHAEGLIALGEEAESDARVWTWWDWGYAVQYFAGLETVADGGLHKGRHIYPLAFSLSADSLEKANRMMIYSARFKRSPKAWIGLEPAKEWDKLARKGIGQAIESAYLRRDLPEVPPQYVAITWKDLTLSQWITYFGNWDLERGTPHKASIAMFNGPEIGFNVQDGIIRNAQGRTGLVKDISVLQSGEVTNRVYRKNAFSPRLMPKQQHLVVNLDASQAILMDDLAHDSTMARLLTADPDDPEIRKHFRLVVDKLPYVRIFEVIQ